MEQNRCGGWRNKGGVVTVPVLIYILSEISVLFVSEATVPHAGLF